jgi:membrane protease YdiL (CAAX protease family)
MIAAGLIASLFLALAFVVYGRLLERLRRGHGKVRAEHFELPDLLVSLVLATFFFGMVVSASWRHEDPAEKTLTADQVLPGSAVFVVMVAAVFGFLKMRGVRLRQVLGLDQLSPWRASGWALLLIFCAGPLIVLASFASLLALGENAERQPLVQLFSKVAQTSDYRSISLILLAGVIVAPISEELLFRGYFFGVGKRYIGAVGSGLATAFLFSAVHANLASFLPLVVFALCVTLAYERTGSILVPIGMHALFNFTSLAALYLNASGMLK